MPNNQLISLLQKMFGGTSSALSVAEADASTAKGSPRTIEMYNISAVQQALDLFGISEQYLKQVQDCTKLSEENLIFTGITNALVKAVAQPPTIIEVPAVRISNRRARKVEDLFKRFLERICWEDLKPSLLKRMLNEGGLSWELVVADDRQLVRSVEYRPHYLIRPIVDERGYFIDSAKAFNQLDISGRSRNSFAQWQIVDHNLTESAFHSRGVPHLAAARQTLGNVGAMLKGVAQKWLRSGGAVEHFNLTDATRWGDVEAFKAKNKLALEASPDSLVRQFYTKGKVTIERVAGDDSSKQDAATIEFLLDLIFFAAGTPKEALGFRAGSVIKDMTSIIWQNYNQTLDFIEKTLFRGLLDAWKFQLLLQGELPEDISFKIIGGEFESTSSIKADKDVMATGALSINEIRRASGADVEADPLFDVPGVRLTPEAGEQLAVDRGVAPTWMVEQVKTRNKQREDMAALAAKAAVEAANTNTSPENAISRPRFESKPSKPDTIAK